MESSRTCLSVIDNQVYMKYFDMSALSNDKLHSRKLLIPSEELMRVTNGCYVIYYYQTRGDYFRDTRRRVIDLKALKYQMKCGVYCYHGCGYVIAKFADPNFTEHIDITPDDIIVKMLTKRFSPEMTEQVVMFNA